MKKHTLFCFLTALCLTSASQASDVLVNCQTASGQLIPVVETTSQPEVASVSFTNGTPTLYVNNSTLPQLSPQARGFLYARACVQAQNEAMAADNTLEQIRSNDCGAVASLYRSGMLGSGSPAQLARIQIDLAEADPQWQYLPGPSRDLALAQCTTDSRYMHSGTVVGLSGKNIPRSESWNRCTVGCGDRLYRCQNGRLSTGGKCMETFRQCADRCGN